MRGRFLRLQRQRRGLQGLSRPSREGGRGQGRLFKPLDAAVFVAALVITVFSAQAIYRDSGGEPEVRIKGRSGEWIFRLSVDRNFPVQGPLGQTLVQIRNGSVRIEYSPCRNQTCVEAGSIDRTGQWVACLPNQVFVKVEGGKRSEGLDAATW